MYTVALCFDKGETKIWRRIKVQAEGPFEASDKAVEVGNKAAGHEDLGGLAFTHVLGGPGNAGGERSADEKQNADEDAKRPSTTHVER